MGSEGEERVPLLPALLFQRKLWELLVLRVFPVLPDLPSL